MQSLLITDDVHQGQFVQHGFKYESIPMHMLPFNSPQDQLAESIGKSDSVFLLLHNLSYLEALIPQLQIPEHPFPIIILAQNFDPRLFDYVKQHKIHHFFTRPFPFRSIAMEIRNLVYRFREQTHNKVLKVRDLEIDRTTYEVKWKGQSIQLRHKEFILLEYLMLNSGKLLSREEILESVWDRNANVFTNTIDVHINKLRKKIDYYVQDKFIHTIHSLGYIFS